MTVSPRLCMVVARARNGVIGRDNDLPWRLKSDMRWFRKTTKGKPVLMGRKTWDSFPKKPLPNRPNYVATRDHAFEAPGARVFSDLSAMVAAARAQASLLGVEEVCILGGEHLYRTLLPQTDRIYLTDVDAAPEGDTVFPELDPKDWRSETLEEVPASETDEHAFAIRVLDRIRR